MKTAFFSASTMDVLRTIHETYESLPEGVMIVLPEPLDEMTDHWEEVPKSSLLVVTAEQLP